MNKPLAASPASSTKNQSGDKTLADRKAGKLLFATTTTANNNSTAQLKLATYVTEHDTRSVVNEDDSWREQLKNAIKSPMELKARLGIQLDDAALSKVSSVYPMKITPYYASLIKFEKDPIWLQCVPDRLELDDPVGVEDPLHEEVASPVPNLTHRYPDRVLLLVSNRCAMYCRFCTRKRRVGHPTRAITRKQVLDAIEYIRNHTEVRDVILSGGDPLLLEDDHLEFILAQIRAIPHVQIIRIGTRAPCTLPQRITKKLCRMLKRYHPLYVNVHFNHPCEITAESARACRRLANAGIPLGSQTVLLKGVNDDPKVMKELFHKLLMIRVKPYYLFQADLCKGTNHFRTPVSDGLKIISAIRGFTSGLAVPHYVIDTPGGGGKVPLIPDYFVEGNEEKVVVRNYEGKLFEYPNPKATTTTILKKEN